MMEQAEDRVHRIGQENSVLVQYLVARRTIDEVLWRMLCNKVGPPLFRKDKLNCFLPLHRMNLFSDSGEESNAFKICIFLLLHMLNAQVAASPLISCNGHAFAWLIATAC